MSDHTAIAAVTRTLQTLLEDRTDPSLRVAAKPPDADPPDQIADGRYLNLYLYRVVESPFLKNQDLPGTGHPGAYGHPPLSLELHYLLTPMGDDETDDLALQEMLGNAMLAIHDLPVVTEQVLRQGGGNPQPILDPVLIGEYEEVKITLEPISVEDLGNLWSAFMDPYRLSVAYEARVVQIESRRPRRAVRPVGEPPEAGPRVVAIPVNRPRVLALLVQRAPSFDDEAPIAYARIGDRLVLEGTALHPTESIARLGPVRVEQFAAGSTAERLLIELGDETDLHAGVHLLQVVRQVRLSEEGDGQPRPILESNVVPFALAPGIEGVTPTAGPPGTEVTITGSRLFHEDLVSTIIVGDRQYSLTNPEGADPVQSSEEVKITIGEQETGTHRVSARVNGIESIEPGFTFTVEEP